MELKGATINILGDSITEGVGASCVENRYADVLEAIRTTGKLENDTAEKLGAALTELLAEFQAAV